jgi:S1-C subfamily serine protease
MPAIISVAFLIAALIIFPVGNPPRAQDASLADHLLEAVVKVSTKVPADARTARNLGTEREGSGVVIDGNGLVLTIGYVMLEAISAEIGLAGGRTVPAALVAYDHDTGFGLLRAAAPLGVKPMELGDSKHLTARDQVLVASFGGKSSLMGAYVVSRRPFAGWWEYLLERAIYTSPPHMQFGGAALIGGDGKLLGIGSLIVGNAAGPERPVPGNMFIPIDYLKPILADLLEQGRAAGRPRPWLGLTSEEVRGRLFVMRVARGGPAFQAGIRPGDLVIGVNGKPVSGLADFYRKVWATGDAGVSVPINVLQGITAKPVLVKSSSRYDWLKLNRSY